MKKRLRKKLFNSGIDKLNGYFTPSKKELKAIELTIKKLSKRVKIWAK